MGEIWDFLKVRKKWWLLPLIIMVIVFGLLMFLNPQQGGPFNYALG